MQRMAQKAEAEWRVVNEHPPVVVPPYANQPNPFPTRDEVAKGRRSRCC